MESSDQGDSGPGSMSGGAVRIAIHVANAGGIARHRPYPTGSVEPIAASTMQGMRRMMPSAPMLMP